jgi:hypothetical protein
MEEEASMGMVISREGCSSCSQQQVELGVSREGRGGGPAAFFCSGQGERDGWRRGSLAGRAGSRAPSLAPARPSAAPFPHASTDCAAPGASTGRGNQGERGTRPWRAGAREEDLQHDEDWLGFEKHGRGVEEKNGRGLEEMAFCLHGEGFFLSCPTMLDRN